MILRIWRMRIWWHCVPRCVKYNSHALTSNSSYGLAWAARGCAVASRALGACAVVLTCKEASITQPDINMPDSHYNNDLQLIIKCF